MTDDTQSIPPEDTGEQAGRDAGSRRPGKLRGRIDTKFDTGEAVALIDGRGGGKGKSRIIGLKGFARRSAIVLEGSERGCPFADYCLVQIQSKLDEVSEHFKAEAQRLNELASARLDPGVSPTDSVAYTTTTWSESPVEEEFILGHYSSRALYCLVQYDRLVLLAKGLQHHQILKREECRQTIDAAGNMIRGLFALGDSYSYTGCTRSDLREKNRVAQEAVASLVSRQFIDPRMFNSPEEIMETFANYDQLPGAAESDDSGAATEEPAPADPGDADGTSEQAVDAEKAEQARQDSDAGDSADQEKP